MDPDDTLAPRVIRAVEKTARAARAAGLDLAVASSDKKNLALAAIAEALASEQARILKANADDLAAGERDGLNPTLLDRIFLDEARLGAISDGVVQIAQLPDPVGTLVSGSRLPNGIELTQVRVPIGVIGAIYEARPNVTVDIAALALKSGNAVILRGGSAAARTNGVLLDVLRWAIASVGLSADLVTSIDELGRPGARALMQARDFVDLLIPRGSASLIDTVVREAIVPVIETGVGNVHMYVDASAELKQTVDLVVNSKVSRPSVCNALETLLVHEKAAKRVLPKVLSALAEAGVTIHGDAATSELAPEGVRVRRATRRDWATEYLGLDLAVSVVPSIDDAIGHIGQYSTGHTEVIVTNDVRAADRFTTLVDSAAVGVNVSTRFTDGGEYGLGAEVGISTQKLHARGPMGVEQLTTTKWIMRGSGQTR